MAPSSPRRLAAGGGRPLHLPPLELLDLVLLGIDDLLSESCDLGQRAVLELGVGHVDGALVVVAIISTKAMSNSVPVAAMRRLMSASLIMPGISVSPWPPCPSDGVMGLPQLRSQPCSWVISWRWLLTMLSASLCSSGRSVRLSTSLAISIACWWWGIMF